MPRCAASSLASEKERCAAQSLELAFPAGRCLCSTLRWVLVVIQGCGWPQTRWLTICILLQLGASQQQVALPGLGLLSRAGGPLHGQYGQSAFSLACPLLHWRAVCFSSSWNAPSFFQKSSATVQVGNIVALGISPLLIERFGWPTAFWVFGSLGLTWLFAWIPLVPKEAPQSASARAAGRLQLCSLLLPCSLLLWSQHLCPQEWCAATFSRRHNPSTGARRSLASSCAVSADCCGCLQLRRERRRRSYGACKMCRGDASAATNLRFHCCSSTAPLAWGPLCASPGFLPTIQQ